MKEQDITGDIRLRIKELTAEKKISHITLGGGTASGAKRIGRQLSGECPISLETVMTLLANLPDVSAEWLLKGVKCHTETWEQQLEKTRLEIQLREVTGAKLCADYRIIELEKTILDLKDHIETLDKVIADLRAGK